MKNRVKELRTAAGMTQQQLADRVHVSSRTIISLEKELYNPSLLLAYRIAELFGVTVEDLYCLEKKIGNWRTGSMKIYNKKKFADGCFFLVLGAALAGAMIWKREIDGKSVVLALIALVIGADALVRSLSRRLSYQDKVEALDERNIQVELRARSRTLSLLRGTLMAVLILSLIGALANPEGELVYGGMMVVSGVLYTLSLFIELACSFYYEGRI